MSPVNNIGVDHHHSTRIMGPKYDIFCNNLQNVKVNFVVLQVLVTCATNGGKSSVMLQYM